MQALRRSTIVVSLPENCGSSSVSNCSLVGIDVGRVDETLDGLGAGLLGGERGVGRGEHDCVDLLAHLRELVFGRVPLRDQPRREGRERVARRIGVAFFWRAIHHFVVRLRMRVRTNHVRVNERRPLPLARVVDRALHRLMAGDEVAAVDFLDVEVGKRRYELGDAAARGVHLDRNRDRVAVVFDEIDDRQLEIARGVQRLPELAFARRAVAGRAEHDLILLESVRDSELASREACLGRADGLEELRSGRRRLRDDVELLVAPVARHLAAAGIRIVRRADRRKQHLLARSCRAADTARDRGSTSRTNRTTGLNTKPAAVRTASWPAPEIWKKILFWRLSWISLSSSRRDRSMVRYAPTS